MRQHWPSTQDGPELTPVCRIDHVGRIDQTRRIDQPRIVSTQDLTNVTGLARPAGLTNTQDWPSRIVGRIGQVSRIDHIGLTPACRIDQAGLWARRIDQRHRIGQACKINHSPQEPDPYCQVSNTVAQALWLSLLRDKLLAGPPSSFLLGPILHWSISPSQSSQKWLS